MAYDVVTKVNLRGVGGLTPPVGGWPSPPAPYLSAGQNAPRDRGSGSVFQGRAQLWHPDSSGAFAPPVFNTGMGFSDIGSSGLRQWSGWVREEFLPQLQGRMAARTYREMLDNSSVCGGLMYAINSSMRKITWRVDPADDSPEAAALAEFFDGCRDDMSSTWPEFIVEMQSMLAYGFAPMEVVYKRSLGRRPPTDIRTGKPMPQSQFNDGMIRWRKIALRGQDTIIKWFFGQDGEITGMTQQPWSGPIIDIPIEKLLLFRPTSHKNNPEGRSILRSAYRCFSDDTDILTESGWKSITEMSKDERLATLNPTTNEIEYHRPTRLYAYPYRGKMFHQGGRFIDQLVTPNHRMWVRRDGATNFEFIEAKDLKKSVYYQRDAVWCGEEVAEFMLAEWGIEQRVAGRGGISRRTERRVHHETKTIPMDDWLRFFGIWLAEGHTYQAKSGQRFVGISQKDGPKLDMICKWIDACGFAYNVKKAKGKQRIIEICSGQLFDHLRQFGKSHDKFIPQEIKALSARQLEILYDAMWAGDGGMIGPVTRYYATVSTRLADDVSELLLKIGRASTVKWRPPYVNGNRFSADGIWIVSENRPRTGGNRANLLKDQREWVDYDGEVYCVEVPNHLVYVRRNGKACWSGNSWYMAKRIEEMEAILFERMGGVPTLYIPNEIMERAASGDANANAKLTAFKQIATNIRIDEQMGLVLPSDLWDGATGGTGGAGQQFRFELVTPGRAGRGGIDSDKVISRYNVNILASVMADFLQLGHESRGTQALAQNKTDMFFNALEGFLMAGSETMNRYAVPRLGDLNGMNPDKLPKYVPDMPQRLDLDVLSNFVLRLSQAGMPLFPNPVLEEYLGDAAGWPDISESNSEAHSIVGPGATMEIQDNAPEPPLGQPPGPPGNSPQDKLKKIVTASMFRRAIRLAGGTAQTPRRLERSGRRWKEAA